MLKGAALRFVLLVGASISSACSLVTDFDGLVPVSSGGATSSGSTATGGNGAVGGGGAAGGTTAGTGGASCSSETETWAASFGTPSLAAAARVDVAPDGSVTLVGRSANSLYVAKRNAATGAEIFSHVIGQANLGNGDVSGGIGAGDIVVAGDSSDALDLDLDGTTDPESNIGPRAFAAAYTLDGLPKWHTYLGEPQPYGVWVWAAAAASDGSIVLGGEFVGSLSLGGNCPLSAQSGSDQDGFMARIDATGACMWALDFGGADQQAITSVAIDLDNDRVVGAGNFSGGVTLPPPLAAISGPSFETFVCGLSAAGTPLYAQDVGYVATEGGLSVTTGAAGHVWLAGTMEGPTLLDPAQPTNAGKEVVAAELDAGGAVVWARLFGGTGADHGFACAHDGSGATWIGGYILGSVDFDGIGLAADPTTADLFVARLDGTGHADRAVSFGDATGWQDVLSLRPHPCGGVALAGRFTGTLDFGTAGGPLTNSDGGNFILYSSRIDVP